MGIVCVRLVSILETKSYRQSPLVLLKLVTICHWLLLTYPVLLSALRYSQLTLVESLSLSNKGV